MTSILLECPDCGGDAEGRVLDADTADGGSETLIYHCGQGCEGLLIAVH
jgi:hypothetical protein